MGSLTPGDWRVSNDDHGRTWIVTDVPGLVDDWPVAQVVGRPVHISEGIASDTAADAAAMAAAPDLLAALQAVAFVWCQTSGRCPHCGDVGRSGCRIAPVIAKATGSSSSLSGEEEEAEPGLD